MIVLVDTAEQTPLPLDRLIRTERVNLEEGDYSARGVEHLIRIERKSSVDLVRSVQSGHKNFGLELARLRPYDHAFVIVEDAASAIEAAYRGRATSPSTVADIVRSLELDYRIPFHYEPNPKAAADYVVWALRRVVDRHEPAAQMRANDAALRCNVTSRARMFEISLAAACGVCAVCARVPPTVRPKSPGPGICVCGRVEWGS